MTPFEGWWRYWMPILAYACLIFYLSSLPHPEAYLPSFLKAVSDKILHAVEYSLLGILCVRAFRHAGGGMIACCGRLPFQRCMAYRMRSTRPLCRSGIQMSGTLSRIRSEPQ